MIRTYYIRKATAKDLDGIFAVINLNLDDYFAPEAIGFFLSQWPEGQFVAESFTGRIVGALCAAKLGGNCASVSLLAVDSSVRGHGAGGSLLDALRRTCMMEGVSTIQLEVRTTNSAAIDFYRRRGFAIAETLPHYYNDGGDGYRMVSATYGRNISPS